MLIDSHQHVFWHYRDDAGLIADMDENGVDLAWLLTWELSPLEDVHMRPYHGVLNPEHRHFDGTHSGVPLSDLIRTRDRYPGRFVLGYCPHPVHDDAPAILEASHRMHGVRVCGEWKFRMLFDDPRCLNLFRKAGELGMPVVLHLDVPYLVDPEGGPPIYQDEWYGGTVANLGRALRACPDTVFIGHAPGFWREIGGDADQDPSQYPQGPIVPGGRIDAMLHEHPNLYADLSAASARCALQRDPEQSRALLERHPDRFLFARDYYGGKLMDCLRGLGLSTATWDAVMCGNAQRLLPTGEI